MPSTKAISRLNPCIHPPQHANLTSVKITKTRTVLTALALATIPCLLPHALTLQVNANLNFGKIDYATPLNGNISMGTNGTISYGSSYSGSGTGTVGQIEIQDSNGVIVDISCADGTIAHSGGGTLTLTTTAVVGSSNVAGYGSNPTCSGLGSTILTHTIVSGAANNTIYVGGRLTPSSLTAGTFNTSNGGGQVIQFQVVVQ